jgi:protein subunit release factor B
MSAFNVTPHKQAQLERRMERLGIREADLEERFIKGSGKGGQKINKTSSCVYLHHRPTGIEIKCQRERSQAMNRFFARRELCEQVAEKIKGEKSERRRKAEKIRRQKRRRSRRAKERMLEKKRKTAEKKKRRGPIRPDE